MKTVFVWMGGLVLLLGASLGLSDVTPDAEADSLANELEMLSADGPLVDFETYKCAKKRLQTFKTNLVMRVKTETILAKRLHQKYETLVIEEPDFVTSEKLLFLGHLEDVLVEATFAETLGIIKRIILDENRSAQTRSSTLARLYKKCWAGWQSRDKRDFLISVISASDRLKWTALNMIVTTIPGYDEQLNREEKELLRRVGLDRVPWGALEETTTARLFSVGIIQRPEYVEWLRNAGANSKACTVARRQCIEKAETLGGLTSEEAQALKTQLKKDEQALGMRLQKQIQATEMPIRMKKMLLAKVKQLQVLSEEEIRNLEEVVRAAEERSTSAERPKKKEEGIPKKQ